jgi:ABC-2 type transport system permease protein
MRSSTLRILWNSILLQMKLQIIGEYLLFRIVFQPMIFTLLSVGLYMYSNKPDLGLFAVIGSGMIGIWNSNLWNSGGILAGERRSGTLSYLIASPTSLPLILLGKSLANTVISLLVMGTTFLTGRFLFGLPLGIQDPPGFLLGLVLVVVALTCMGLVLSSLFVLSRNAPIFMGVANYPIFVLTGLTFPLTLLPWWIRPVSSLLAPTWGNLALNQAAGLLVGSAWVSWLWLIGLSCAYLLIARLLFRRVEYLARQAGTLEKW